MAPADNKKTVVVVGLGYAGVKIASKLDGVANVIAIDRHTHHFHAPAGPLAIVDAAYTERLRGLTYSSMLKYGEVVQGEVTEVNDTHVRLANGREIKYDYTVIASGSSYTGIIKSSTKEPLETLKVFDAYRIAMSTAKRILVVGGGLAGIEYAGFTATAFPNAKVTLVQSGPNVLSNVPHIAPKAQADVKTKLERHGVELVFNERIQLPAESEDLTVPKPRTLQGTTRTFESDVQLFLTGLSSLNTKVLTAAWASTLVSTSGLKVNAFLQLEGHPRIFAAGDVAATGAAKTAANAGVQADVLIKSLTALLAHGDGATLTAYKPGHTMFLASLSPTSGTAQGLPWDQWSVTGWLGNYLSKLKSGDFFIGKVAAELNVVV